MNKRLTQAAIEGFSSPFRLTMAIVMSVVAVVLAFVSHSPLPGLDREPAKAPDHGK